MPPWSSSHPHHHPCANPHTSPHHDDDFGLWMPKQDIKMQQEERKSAREIG